MDIPARGLRDRPVSPLNVIRKNRYRTSVRVPAIPRVVRHVRRTPTARRSQADPAVPGAGHRRPRGMLGPGLRGQLPRRAQGLSWRSPSGVEVINVNEFDDEGTVFGTPDQVEIDIIIKNGELILCELKSSMSKSDVYTFERPTSARPSRLRAPVRSRYVRLDAGATTTCQRQSRPPAPHGQPSALINWEAATSSGDQEGPKGGA